MPTTLIETTPKPGHWVEITNPGKNRPNYLIKGSSWLVLEVSAIKKTCTISNNKEEDFKKVEVLNFEEVSQSSPFKKTDIVQLSDDPRYIGRVVLTLGDRVKVNWANGKAEYLDSDQIKLFIKSVKGEQILLGEYAFKQGDQVISTYTNLGRKPLIVERCYPSGIVEVKTCDDQHLRLPGMKLSIIKEAE